MDKIIQDKTGQHLRRLQSYAPILSSHLFSIFKPFLSIFTRQNTHILFGIILNCIPLFCITKFCRILDEFQNLAAFDDPVAFQSKLRSHWQLHQNVTFCLYGSKRHMLMDVFTKPAMPFYNFGDILFLQKIKTEDWIPFLTSKFEETGKILSPEEAKLIAETARCHPYYVQQLAQQTWLRTHLTCSEDIVLTAWNSLQDQLSLLFQNLTDSLSPTQLNYLKAVSDKQTQMTSKTVIDTYRLGTPGNVKKIKEALENREIIDLSGKTISFLDPLYEAWLKRDGLQPG